MDLLNRVYKPYLDKFMIVFIDDIFICSSRNKEYEERLRLILGFLKNKEFHGFYHKPAKDNKSLLHDLGNRDSQKNYDDVRRKPLEFQVEGISVERSDMSWKTGKAEPPTNSFSTVGSIKSYEDLFPTFHVSNLKKYLADETLAIPLDEIQIDKKLHFIEEPVEIMDREVKHLK
ncbi:hypothetical protein Tco_1069010 [Tanacetum coccineum]|uniref:Reverse transcriptase domain-containing protein n=1 Tax=Tanacetum coccineum TaxID=301880 RepID=A0ABQ5HJI1_9ASTR